MATRRNIIYIPSFSEYAYRTLKGLNATQRAALTETELKHLKDDYTLRNFVNKEPFENILLLLTKSGKQWDIRVYDEEEVADHMEFTVVNQYQYPEKRGDVIGAQVTSKTYHMSCMDVMLSSHMLAQNVHTKIYEVSTGIKKITEKSRGIAKIKVSHESQLRDGSQAVDDLNKLLLNQLNSFDWAKSTLGLEQNELRILSALFARKDGAMTSAEIGANTLLTGKAAYLKKNMDKLLQEGLIVTDLNHGPKTQLKRSKLAIKTGYYMISSKGVDKMMSYRNYLHKLTFGA